MTSDASPAVDPPLDHADCADDLGDPGAATLPDLTVSVETKTENPDGGAGGGAQAGQHEAEAGGEGGAVADELPHPEPDPEPDPEALRRRQEALRYVRKLGDPALRAKAIPVDRFDDELVAEIERMGELMDAAMGVGLAATQLGVLHRVLVYRVEHDSPVVALVNPTLEWAGREQETIEEGCLSLPGVLVDVERAVHLRVGARDERGEPITVEASGLEARVIAHEMDHLDGVLILDRTTREQRREAMRRMREAQASE